MVTSTKKIEPLNISGQTIIPQWQDLFNVPPRCFYDKATKTLGLDGDWSAGFDHLAHSICVDWCLSIGIDNDVEYLYLGENYNYDDDSFTEEYMASLPVSVSPKNTKFDSKNGIPVLKKDNTPALSSCGDGLYRLIREEKSGIIDQKLNNITPFKYDNIWYFDSNGLCKVEIDNHYGLVNKLGEEQVDVIYEDIQEDANFYKVRLNGEKYTIDKFGKRINGTTKKHNRLNMEFLNKPKATVGQIVKDLEQIVAKSPNIFLEYSNDDGNGMFVEGIKIRKDIAILETTGNMKRAVTVEDLLAMCRMLDESLGVVMQDGWEMKDFEPYEDGSILLYDEDDDYCQFIIDRDVRLITTQQMLKELKDKGVEKALHFKVAAVSNDLKTIFPINSVVWEYNKLCLCYDKSEEANDTTIGSLMEEFPACAEVMVKIKGKFYTIGNGEKGIFASYKMGGENYICFRLGEMVYNPNEVPE